MYWKILKQDYIYQCPWLKLRKDHIVQPTGIELEDFYVVESADWVNVIAITDDQKIIFERQYRHGIADVCLELPAGSINERETPLQAAQRELLEETGYGEGEWKAFGTYAPNASGMTAVCFTFLACGVRKIAAQHLEPSEDLFIELYPIAEVSSLLRNNDIKEAVMQAPLWRFLSDYSIL